jgi:peptidyl-prolyl cis-trans isomerase C
MNKNPDGGLSRLLLPCLLTTLLSTWSGLTFALANTDKAYVAELSKPYVTVNGIAQPTAWAELIFRDQRQRGAPASAQLRQSVRDVLITQAVIEEVARKAGIDADPLIQAQMDLARREVLIRAWQHDFVSRFSASDAAIQAEYTRQIERIGDKEYLLRHLLLSDESAAKLLIEKVKAGAKLETLSNQT